MHEAEHTEGSDARPLPVDVADPHAPLRTLQDRLLGVVGDADAPMGMRARELAGIEGGLLATLPELARLDPDFDGIRGHPTLADAARWRDDLEAFGLDASAAQTLVDELSRDEAERFSTRARAACQAGDAATCFGLLRDTTLLEREALVRRADGIDLAPIRVDVRRRFLYVNEASPADEATLDEWATDLLDTADAVLTGIDDVAPVPAARHLELTARDVSWHLEHISPQRGWRHRRLDRKLRRLTAERQERQLQGRLEDRYGVRAVTRFERAIVWLIFFVLAALTVDTIFDLDPAVQAVLLMGDTLACFVFLYEFFVKLRMVDGRWRWFWRHFLIDFLPSLPFGLVQLGNLQGLRAGRALRLFRFFRFARYMRWLLPAVRVLRAFGFLVRGLDRLVRRYGPLLNRNIILYPNRVERAAAEKERHGLMVDARRLRSAISQQWVELLENAAAAERGEIATIRVEALERARVDGHANGPTGDVGSGGAAVDVPAEALMFTLGSMNPQELEAEVGEDFIARAARAVRLFARVPIRWFPVVRRYVPELAPGISDAGVVTDAAHSIAAEMQRHHERWFWCADLYGTVTPSEFVDRVGTAMMKGSTRPAYRLVIFGGFFWLFQMLLGLGHSPVLGAIKDLLGTFVGIPLYVLGSICLVLLALGWWMKRIAGEATFFFEQTVKAQFLGLTETIKGRFISRDVHILDRRVIGPEEQVHQVAFPGGHDGRRSAVESAVRSWLVEAQVGAFRGGHVETLERVVMLYRDGLDGALFGESDTRTTSQLIGNPALRQIRLLSDRVDRKERKALRALDLERQRLAIRGPYLWFSYISKAVGQAAARLIVEYNRHAIPTDELEYATDENRQGYESWVQRDKPLPADVARTVPTQDLVYVTTAFTALHFLDDDPSRDAEVEARFGSAVLENLRSDRRLLFRTVFGTFPRHTRPKDRRVLNLYRLYESWFAGGRALLIPIRLLWRALQLFGSFVSWLVGAIGEIRKPKPRHDPEVADAADFSTAVRKIDRMRGPIVWACLWLRARFDAEYLGIELPGAERDIPRETTVLNDLRFLGADPVHIRQVAEERDRAETDVRRFAQLLDAGLVREVADVVGVHPDLMRPEHIRAGVAAYRADMAGVRTLLSCAQILDETSIQARRRPVTGGSWLPRFALRRKFKRWWAAHGEGGRTARRAMWRSVVANVNGVRVALDTWAEHGPKEAHERGVRELAGLLRHVGRITEQIVTLRTVQTLSLIDLLNYRGHVYRVGRYEDSGDVGGDQLTLDPGVSRPLT